MKNLFKIQLAEILRDTSHNFVIEEPNELDNDAYFIRLKCFIEALEGSRNEAYIDGIVYPKNSRSFISVSKFNALDPQKQDELEADCIKSNGKDPIKTVGIGLNIESEVVRKQYDKLLGQPGLMQDIYEGKKTLTDEQVSLIFKDCLQERLIKIRQDYGSDWDKLRANERICIHSLYFNNPRLSNWKSNFRKHIGKYVETNDVTYLQLAVEEVTKRSNPANHHGIQNRRNAEGALLASYECPTFTKPCDDPASRFPRMVRLNETLCPSEGNSSLKEALSGYFIWRTEMDAKVREKHLRLEGKVFRKDDPENPLPGTSFNCRCRAEEVPDHILIMDEDTEKKAFNLYLRTGLNIHHIVNLENRV